jgi:hypothetical protein
VHGAEASAAADRREDSSFSSGNNVYPSDSDDINFCRAHS